MSWTYKQRISDFIKKFISLSNFWAIVATILLILGFVGEWVWSGIIGIVIGARTYSKATQYRNGIKNTNKNDEQYGD